MDTHDTQFEASVVLHKVSKHFSREYTSSSFLRRLVSGYQNYSQIKVLDEVSMRIGKGKIIGIIGDNGSGKSTLLRTIAGVYRADSGSVFTYGKVIYLSGAGYGLKDKLTVRENIYYVCGLMGFSRRFIDAKLYTIVSFCGLWDFVDVKCYQLSRGMISRLNFSIAIHCLAHQNPDIILLDEALFIGGDAFFRREALAKLSYLISCGATVFIASHNLGFIRRYCSWTFWLDKGKIKMKGKSREVICAYLARLSE